MTVRVVDEPGAAQDPALACLRGALDPAEAERRIAPLLQGTGGDGAPRGLREIRVVRHKQGRRCLVVYRFDSGLGVYGKVRARGADVRTHRLLEALWASGFRPGGGRGAAVPEPLGILPELKMTLQREVHGRRASELVAGPEGVGLMRRVALAIHELHRSGAVTRRRHPIAEELRILDQRLRTLSRERPRWQPRLERVLCGCRALAGHLRETPPRGIHRDFYPDQLIVDDGGVTLLDLDLYALGDPALDVGNFSAHLTEQALRCLGDPAALRDRAEALEESHLELAEDVTQAELDAYATLTLARHVHLSTLFPERRHTTSPLLELCEERLGIRSSGAVGIRSGRRASRPSA